MFRYNDGTFKQTPPTMVVYDGNRRRFADLTRAQWDEIGYNEAVPIKREPYTSYETSWNKGEDLIYREMVVSAVVDEAAKAGREADLVRIERDVRLEATDWTQVLDCPLDDMDMVLWQSYRQALRDVPQQSGFPASVEWPEPPMAE